MKIKTFYFIAVLIMLGCSDDSSTPAIDFKQYAGIWVPYEVTYPNGTINNGPFIGNSIFGVYAESFQLTEDKTYMPVIWTDKNSVMFKPQEGGNFEYVAVESKLFFTKGVWDLEFKITKYSNDELWLTYTGNTTFLGNDPLTQFKLKRQPAY